MRVLFLQRQPCIRAMKYALGLRALHPEVALGFAYQGKTLTGWYGSGDELFEGWWSLPADDAASAFADSVEEFHPTLVHSHNLPDSLTVLALDVLDGRVPVIHDVHDLQSLRQTPYEDGFEDPDDPADLESAAVEGCAALIAVSQEMLDEIDARHSTPARRLLFANYALERDIAPDASSPRTPSRPPRVVYQGSLSANGSHYDLRDHFAAIAASGLPVDVFPNRAAPAYRELAARTDGMTIMETHEPAALLQKLPAYDVGWTAFNTGLNAAHLDTALPNKAFEYLASGLPIAVGPHRALERLVRDHGVGVVVARPGDLAGRLEEADLGALRERVAASRRRFTVEGHIGALVDLYRETADSPVPGLGTARPQGAGLHSPR